MWSTWILRPASPSRWEFDPDRLDGSLHDVFVRGAKMADVRRPVAEVEGLSLAPATIDLAGAEVHLLTRTGREHVLARALQPILPEYDVVLIDCPPSLGILTINGLTAATEVLIPLQCESLSQRGVGQLLETIEDVRLFANEDLAVLGVIATMHDSRTRHARPRPGRGGFPVRPGRPRTRRFPSRSVSPSPRARPVDLPARTPVGRGRRLPGVGGGGGRTGGGGVPSARRPAGQAGPLLGGDRSRAGARCWRWSAPGGVPCAAVGVVKFLRLQLPLALWLPGRTFDRKMTSSHLRAAGVGSA